MKPNSCACYGSNDIHECYCNLNKNNMKSAIITRIPQDKQTLGKWISYENDKVILNK
jgi:hypothetical protein